MNLRRPTPPGGGLVPLRSLVRGSRSVLGNLTTVWDGKPRSPAPSFISWVLTERCPLGCEHCDMGQPRGELGRIERADLAERIGRSDVWAVSLVGGEVSILPDLADLAAILKRHGKFVSIATSGLALARHLPKLLDAGIDSLVLSVDHSDAAAHDRFRGVPGLHARVEAAIAQVLARRTAGRPRIGLRYVVHRGNVNDTAIFVERWHGKVEQIVLQIVQDNGQHRVRDRSVLFEAEDRPALEAMLADVGKRWPDLRTRTFDLMARYTFEAETLRKDLGFRCLLVPATQLVILPDGAMRLCYGRDDSAVGHLRERSFESAWMDARTEAIRRKMQSADYGCMCWEAACAGNLDLLPAARALDSVRQALGL